MEPITITVQLSREDFMAASQRMTRRVILGNWRVIFIPLGILIWVNYMYSNNGLFGLFGSIAVVLLAVALFIWKMRQQLHKSFDASFRNKERIVYALDTAKCVMTGESFQADLPWIHVPKVELWREYYLIYATEKTAHVVPKSSMAQGQDVAIERLFDHVKPGWRK